MDKSLEKYVKNIVLMAEAMSLKAPKGMPEDKIIGEIRQKALSTYLLHEENDEILRERLYSKKPGDLSEEEAAGLSEFADAIFPIDKAVAYHVHRLLHDYAVLKGDRDLIIRSAYYMGLNVFYLRYENNDIGVSLFMDRIADHFGEAAEYYSEYDSFKSSETRSYIVRSYANRKLSPSYFNVIDTDVDLASNRKSFEAYRNHRRMIEQTLGICFDEKRRSENPEIPWDSFIETTYQGEVSFCLTSLRNAVFTNEQYNLIAKNSLYAASYLIRRDGDRLITSGKKIPIIDRYRFAASEYHAGLIHPNKLIETLLEIYDEVPHDDFSSDGIFANLRIPAFINAYRSHMNAEGRKKYGERAEKTIAAISDYLMKLPRNQYINEMSRYLGDIVWASITKKQGYNRQILDYILACHPPTYIHSHMVAWLCETLFLRIIETDPDSLRGIMGIEYVPAIRDSEREVARAIYRCGLYHDLGKCMIIEHVGNYTRRLTDEEFAVIKLHPILGNKLLLSMGSYEIEASAALNHHRTYDRKGGYPADAGVIPRKAEAIVDILTVADALDAGTDNVGRCYAASKTVDTLIDELKKGSGTRYAPYVVKVFDDPAFCSRIKREIDKKRRKIYAKTYVDMSRDEGR